MVPDSGAKAGAARLRPLNLPCPIQVITHQTPPLPAVLIDGDRRLRIERIQDSWDVDEEWWRDRLSRRYYQLLVEGGGLRTVYQNLVDGSWYEQNY